MKMYTWISSTYKIYIEKKKPYIAMVVVQFSYAGMFLICKSAFNAGMNPYIFVAYRQAFATAFLAPFALLLDKKSGPDCYLSRIILLKIFLVSLFGVSLSLNLHAYSMKYTSATFAAATTNTIPLMTFVMAALLRMESVSIKKKHGMGKVMGSAIGFCGAMLFAFVKGPPIINFMDSTYYLHNNHNEEKKDGLINYNNIVIIISDNKILLSDSDYKKHDDELCHVKGSFLMLFANFIWSSWLIMLAPIVKEYPAKLRLSTMQCLFSCIQSAIFAIAMERNVSSWKLGWDINLFSVLYSGMIVSGVAYWLQLSAVESRGPVFTAMFTPFALIMTAIISAIVWKEVLHLGSVCGGILLVGGLYIVLWGKKKEAKEEEKDDQNQIIIGEEEEEEKKEQKSESNKETDNEMVIIECITHH